MDRQPDLVLHCVLDHLLTGDIESVKDVVRFASVCKRTREAVERWTPREEVVDTLLYESISPYVRPLATEPWHEIGSLAHLVACVKNMCPTPGCDAPRWLLPIDPVDQGRCPYHNRHWMDSAHRRILRRKRTREEFTFHELQMFRLITEENIL